MYFPGDNLHSPTVGIPLQYLFSLQDDFMLVTICCDIAMKQNNQDKLNKQMS